MRHVQSVSLLQNSEMFKKASCARSQNCRMYLIENSDMFEDEIKNPQKLKII